MLRNRPRLAGALVGLLVTALCTAAFFSLDFILRMELAAFDWRANHCNTLAADPSIVHVDVDDGSLERIGKWPWPRDRMADLVRTLHELGAAHVFIDFLLSEPQPPYVENPAYGPYSETGAAYDVLGEVSRSNEVYPDLELADAFRSAGNVVLATHLKISPPGAADPAPTKELQLRADVCRTLLGDFTLNEDQVAQRLERSLEEVSRVFAGAKTAAAEAIVDQLFSARAPPPSQAETLYLVLGSHGGLLSLDRLDIEKAWCRAKALSALRRSLYRPETPPDGRFYRVDSVEPPEYHLAEAAAGLAAVNFTPDPDYAVRRVPLVVTWEGGLLNHLGFAAACRACDLAPEAMTREPDGTLAIPCRGSARRYRVPMDENGEMLIHWTATGKDWRSGRDIRHIAASAVLALVDARGQMRANRIARDYLLADIIALVKGQVSIERPEGQTSVTSMHADTRYRDELVNARLKIEDELRRGRLFGGLTEQKGAELRQRAEVLAREIEREQTRAVTQVQLVCRDLAAMTPAELEADPKLKRRAEQYRAALRAIEGELPRYDEADRKHEKTIAGLLRQLTAELAGKYVFLGFAATAEGDIVPTPIDKRTNGVMCHAYVLNSFLQNRFLARAPFALEVAICALVGAIVSALTAASAPRAALVGTLILIAAYALFASYVVFMRLDIWLAIVAPCGTMFITWAFVTLFRQLTAERDRRMFARQLSQYTSPAIAAKIAESPQAAAAFKTVQTRDVSCYFSDLAGFTSISERQGPQIVQHVLNTYLERMSEVIWSRRGLINKFMGDGVMAFFNSSVDPLEDHPRAACEAALASLEALERLKQERAGDWAAEVFRQLQMRIGLSTGLVMNGDLGSELKADYTVIGDVVNLAARLEPANKVFGTRILVSGPLRDAVCDHFEFRYLAELRVSGKAATVPAYELICMKGGLSEEQRAYVERFEAGVELYKARKWDECIVHFTRILARRFDDTGASRYIDACQEFKQFPPDDNWAGALELKEK